ncbi:MAG: sugar ABC transporter ATP-binding protein [Burkholderiales bacterium RIFCSPHIGHO2_02_FULL_66_10]|jgi:lipopolysaccharide transport system ATP-binding protein|uniref:ABC transporter ATP-binding protein n=1 Tax=Hydrogenophaga sp. TaxID=1904254 RepID=UPI0008B6316E|nr:ABC transporter ATP-binding protein [Hydrogenophaga sp.]MBU4183479.1 ABC transporter ATP-binding protein [Gammaproteobacteria bacterium]MBW8466969.1 ABC transporter ATP-binding protein [Thiobacillus sp.]OGB27154.1 MAG: sugar ABC transporter ATP-binding protein [Burkholderiales bacterium RIFCSPHIGHO2_02_FULL_66_10]OGB37294.1 MAG: sugar ABC transporter ATP-binding protein [Burkholderiales bacterium RIFCSPLOWO2_02_FULL_66_35]OGB38192.1 MAG: sugar ABC transporter ATP-binding protein [Burkholder
MSTSISARQLTVEFPIFENSHRSLKKKVLHLTTGGTIGNDAGNHPVVCALDALDFEFKDGDRVGLVGHNGSGKTTLLRVLSGIYSPTRGQLKIKGKTASLLDVSTGVDPDATGFENIYLRGIMNGFKPSMIRSKIDEIADFTELGEYLNLPVRTYSSGMMLRLTFAISTSIQADILLMDEWLSVGDADFREKAAKRLKALVDNASILVIASHNPELIDNVCNKKLQLEHGKIVASEVLGQASNPAPALA